MNINTISIPKYAVEYGSKLIYDSHSILPIGDKINKDIYVEPQCYNDRYRIFIVDTDKPLLTKLQLSSNYHNKGANQILCFIGHEDLKDKKIVLVNQNDNIYMQKLVIKYHQKRFNITTLIECNSGHNHKENKLFEEIKHQPEHMFYPLIKKYMPYDLLQQHGLIPTCTKIVCASCDITIPYNSLNSETADPQSILNISAKHHKNKNRISKDILDDDIMYYCSDKTEYSELIQLQNNNDDAPLTHYHALNSIASHDFNEDTPLAELCDMSSIYFFLKYPQENILGDAVIIKYANPLCKDLATDLLAVNYINEKNNLFKTGMYLDSIARFICSHSQYLKTKEQQLNKALELLELFLGSLQENGLSHGLLSILFQDKDLDQTQDIKLTDSSSSRKIDNFKRLFSYVETINQLYLFPLLEIIIQLMADLNLQENPNSDFIKRLLPLLQTIYIFPTTLKNSDDATTEQHKMLLKAITQANNMIT
jgi:hypothetical protein